MHPLSLKSYRPIFILSAGILLSLLMHLPHFHKDLISVHAWRQTQTQTTIQAFYEEDGNILNPRRYNRGSEDGIFRMEFPLMQWLISRVYFITGSSVLVTRIFLFLTGIGCVIALYFWLQSLLLHKMAAAWGSWAFCFSPAFYYYTLNPIPDVFALFLGLSGLALIRQTSSLYRNAGLLLLSFSALCKLPFILFMIAPAWPMVIRLYRRQAGDTTSWLFMMVALLFPLSWYLYVIPGWKGNGIVQGMLENQATLSDLSAYFFHNLISTLPELLVNYAALPFFLYGIFQIIRNRKWKAHPELMLLGFALVAFFLFELNMIARVHDYYLFPFYALIPLAITLGIRAGFQAVDKKVYYITFLLLLVLPLTAWLRMQHRWDERQPGFNADLYQYRDALRKAVPDDALCIAGNDESGYIFFYYIHKKGWSFQKDEPTADQLRAWRNMGAAYLYSDSQEIEARAREINLLDTLVGQYGSIRVFKLNKMDEVPWYM